jgi:hypothetical protein
VLELQDSILGSDKKFALEILTINLIKIKLPLYKLITWKRKAYKYA